MIDLFSDTELQRHSSLAREASDGDILKYLIGFSSYDRTGPMALLMTFAPPLRCLQIFLTCGNMCDAPWPYRKLIADALRPALTEVSLAEILQSTWPEEHAFYTALPDSVTVWRGCESGRERGLH
jgi:hypothetical protein